MRRPQFIRLYGRRRIGKTRLLRELVPPGTGLYLEPDVGDSATQLRSLAGQISGQSGGAFRTALDWEGLLDGIEATGRRLVVVDEFQNLIERDMSFATCLQRRWDSVWQHSGPSLIISGSSIGMMHRVTGYRKGPFYGRLTADLHLQPFEYAAARLLYPRQEESERIERYAIFGGTPFYHLMNLELELGEAVRRSFFTTDARLAEEPSVLLRSETTSPARYASILEAIGSGARDLQEIGQKAGIPESTLMGYITTLRDSLDLIETDEPLLGKRRSTRYRLSDPFFEFYYRFVSPNRVKSAIRGPEAVWKDIAGTFNAHVGHVFERVARNCVTRAAGSEIKGVPCNVEQVGSWWNRQGEEIDLLAVGKGEVWAGEVVWSVHPVGTEDVTGLFRKIPLIEHAGGRRVLPMIVSRSGVTPSAAEMLRTSGGLWMDLKDMRKIFETPSPMS